MKRYTMGCAECLGEGGTGENQDGSLCDYAEAMDELTKFAREWARLLIGRSFGWWVIQPHFADTFPGYRLVGDSIETCRVEEIQS